MSSGGGIIGLEIRILAILIKSLIDLGIQYRELRVQYRDLENKPLNAKGVEDVNIVIQDKCGKDITFAKGKDGNYKIISDNKWLDPAQIKKQQDFIKQIRQRYAYNKVLGDLKQQGYIIAQEEKVANNTIRLVARKWS